MSHESLSAEVDATCETLLRASIEIVKQRKVIAQMLLVLADVHHELRGREDVYDGPGGKQLPNDAMEMLNEFGDRMEAAIAAASEISA